MGKDIILPDGYYWKSYKFKLYPTLAQKEFLDRNIELSRFVFNWALAKQEEHYTDHNSGKVKNKFYSVFDLDHLFAEFRNKPGNEWLKHLPLTGGRYAIRRVCNGIVMHSKHIKFHFPKFKSKKNTLIGSYQVRNDRFYIRNGKVRIEGLPNGEFIEARCPLEIGGYNAKAIKIYQVVINKDSTGIFWLNLTIQKPKVQQSIIFDKTKDNVIGIDLNVKDRFVCSNGYKSGSPKISHYQKLRSKYQSSLAGDIKRRQEWEKTNPDIPYVQSKRELKRAKRYRKMRKKIANVVNTFIHTHCKRIIDMMPTMVVMEHMDNLPILKEHRVAQYTQDAAFAKCTTIMKDKCNKHSIPFMLAPDKFPSSQLCSNCGARYKIGSSRIYKCSCCGLVIDRDINAALNLRNLAFT